MEDRVLYLLPEASTKGGMAITTKMYDDYGIFKQQHIKHFNTSFTWGVSKWIRFLQSIILKIRFIVVLLKFKPKYLFVISSAYFGYFDKIMYCYIANKFGVKTCFNAVSGSFIDFHKRRKVNRFLIAKTINIPNILIVGSQYWKNYFSNLYPKIKIAIIPNPIIVEQFKAETKNKDYSKVRVLSAFRLIKEKGTDELLEVINKTFEQKIDIEFTIMGAGSELDTLKNKLSKHISQKKVHLVGHLEDTAKTEIFKTHNVFLMLTHNDMMPISILEAMSASQAILSTKVGSIPDVISQNENGFLFEIGEVQQVVEMLMKLDKNKQLIKKIGESNLNKVITQYDIRVIIEQQNKIFEELAN